MFQSHHHLQVPSAYHHQASELHLRKLGKFAVEPTSVLDLSAHISPLNSPGSASSASSDISFASSNRSITSSSCLGRSSSVLTAKDDAFAWPEEDGIPGKALIDIDFDFDCNDHLLYATSGSGTAEVEQRSGLLAPDEAMGEGTWPTDLLLQEKRGVEMIHMLLACVESIQQNDHAKASMILQSLAPSSSGSPIERVTSYIAEALRERISKVTTLLDRSSFTAASKSSRLDVEAAQRSLYKHFPYLKFAHFTANQAMIESFTGADRLHIVDLDVGQGLQWPNMIQILATTSQITSLRLTGIGQDMECLRQTGKRLTEFAKALGVIRFHFQPVVAESIELLDPSLVMVDDHETLAVSCSMVLHRLLGNQPALERILTGIKSWRPRIVTITEVEANHNVPTFAERFVEALHFYSAVFDSIELSLERNDPERLSIERAYFGNEIRNILACEGADRVVRHARNEQWRECMRWSGFTDMALSTQAVYQAQIFLALYSDAYKISRDGSAFILGWKETPIVSVSAWSLL